MVYVFQSRSILLSRSLFSASPRLNGRMASVLVLTCLLLLNLFTTVSAQVSVPQQLSITQQERVLNVFEVGLPVKLPIPSGCTTKLMEYSFGFSYGKPYIGAKKCNQLSRRMLTWPGSYTPPSCDFNRVTLTLTVTSAGRQFDRLVNPHVPSAYILMNTD